MTDNVLKFQRQTDGSKDQTEKWGVPIDEFIEALEWEKPRPARRVALDDLEDAVAHVEALFGLKETARLLRERADACDD